MHPFTPFPGQPYFRITENGNKLRLRGNALLRCETKEVIPLTAREADDPC